MFINNELYKVELTTELVPFISVDMYQSYSPDNLFTIDDFSSEYEGSIELQDRFEDADAYRDFYYDHFDNDVFEEHVLECAKKIFNESYLPDMKKKVSFIDSGKVIKIVSPKSYNYTTDNLYFDIYLNEDVKTFWNKFKSKIKEDDFNEYLHETYRSRSGFISFMPNSIQDIEKILENKIEDEEYVVAVMLNYILSNLEDPEKYKTDFVYAFIENTYILDFVKNSYNEALEEVEINESYIKSYKRFKQ